MIRIPRLAPLATEATVADVLDLDAEAVAGLAPFELGAGARRAQRPTTRGPYRRSAEVDALLEPYAEDAAAGVPDPAVARRVGLSPEQVRKWRIRRGLVAHRGRPRTPVMARFAALHLLGQGPAATMHEVAPAGAWRTPEYVLRRPLAYTSLCAVVEQLLENGMSVTTIAHGIGLHERDVIEAAAMSVRSPS